MMRDYSDKEIEMSRKIRPYLVFDGDKFVLKEDAPQEIRDIYILYQKLYVEPSKKAMESGALFY